MKNCFEGRQLKTPDFFFLDPLTRLSHRSMDLVNRMRKKFKFTFMPVRHHPNHPDCVQFAHQNVPPEIITGTQTTRLHVQTGGSAPPEELTKKDKGTPVFKTSLLGATLTMFKLGVILMCHFHLPATSSAEILNTNYSDRAFYTLFSQMRQLRVPTDFHITTDGLRAADGSSFPNEYYMNRLRNAARKLDPFMAPNIKCKFRTRQNFKQENVDILDPKCHCLLCKRKTNPSFDKDRGPPSMIELFKGDINELIGKNISSKESEKSTKSKRSVEAVISQFTAVDEEDFDTPLDPLGLTDDDELDKFLNSHPGFEDIDHEEEPPPEIKPVKSDRNIVKNPPIGIPDSFTPADWRDHFDINKVEVSEKIKEGLIALLDKYKNLLSCYATDCRPILVDGEPAVVDIELTTDKPIFIKPYVVSNKMSEILDKKIEEMLDRDEIVEIDSPYNIPILLTHHNSENKHIPFELKKFRMCLDLRPINSVMVFKNKFSFMVKGIDPLYARLFGMGRVTKIDMRKAYRSMVASWFTRYVCAFRTPSSIKYPFHTWAFRSTPDGLANLPGSYSYFVQKALSPKSRLCTIQHLDDLLVFSPDDETHLKDLEGVFEDLMKANFLISIPKLEAFKKEVVF